VSAADLAEASPPASAASCPDVDLFLAADWDFPDSPRRLSDIHPYPARFIPELPALALDCLRPNGPVLDPFCGSGTTLVEAMRRGHQAIGVDLNPIACLISRVKTTRWDEADESVVETQGRSLVAHAAAGSRDVLSDLGLEIPRLDHWFAPWAQRILAGAVKYVRQLDPSDPWRDRLALAVSASTVRISNQDSDTRYAAVEKSMGPELALRTLEDAFRRIVDWLRANTSDVATHAARVIEADARSMSLGDGLAAAAVFSPPYPNAYEYWLYHKYRMYWLGFDPIRVRGSEIGARPHYSGSGTLTADDFRREMTEVFSEVHRLLQPGGAAVVIVGDSIIRGDLVDNSDTVTRAADSGGFDLLASRFRLIRRASTSFNRQHARARDGEHVLLFSRRD
jgi:site-specific DNA-methyltransferase (cytosine-N4-specific)